MKGGMILSLVTLCVTMLLMADRISAFLNGPEETSGPDFMDAMEPDIDWRGLWNDFSTLFSGRPERPRTTGGAAKAASGEAIVISEDTLYRAWVWTGSSDQLHSSDHDPENGRAREILVPRGMTVAEFLAAGNDTAAPTAKSPGSGIPREELTPPSAAPADTSLSLSERQRLMREGMRMLRDHRAALEGK
jgi:hypothetical protein